MTLYFITNKRNVMSSVDDICEHFQTKDYVLLVAQMQSGKTGTYLDVARNLFDNGTIESVVIFSGNRERLLYKQTIERVNEFAKNNSGIIKVIWGGGLNKFVPDKSLKTLYIWDESHYGQSKGMLLESFCSKCGINTKDGTNEKNVLCLSVSATPFSEVYDAKNSNKRVVFQKAPKEYWSIRKMTKKGLIHMYSKLSDTLDEQFTSLSMSDKPMVGLIRILEGKNNDNKEMVFRKCREHNLSYEIYDQSKNDELFMKMIEEPQENKVIILKGKLSMGKTLDEKRNVMFCIETTKKKNTDSLVQGLIGRFCGYNKLNKEVNFFIHEKSEHPIIYSKFFKTKGEVMPHHAMNIVMKKEVPQYHKATFKLDNKKNLKTIIYHLMSVDDKVCHLTMSDYTIKKKGIKPKKKDKIYIGEDDSNEIEIIYIKDFIETGITTGNEIFK